jgi:sodium transport system permease protein
MKNAMTVFRKEFYRVVSDKRLLFTAVLMPGLIIFLMYSLMGNAIGNEAEDIESHTIVLYGENIPNDFSILIDGSDREFEVHDFDDMEYDDIKEGVLNGTIDLVVQFPENFETTILNYDDPTYVIPEVNTIYNPGERYSNNAYYYVSTLLSQYSFNISYDRLGEDMFVFHTDLDNPDHIIMDERKASGQGFAMLLPMLIVMFLFSGAMTIGPDSIAGEKERGTIATLLVTPIKRSELATGKVLSLSVIALMSATSSFVGIMASLPILMQGEGLSTDIYGFGEYILIFSILIATVLVIVGLVSCISAYAKNIKEASMLILPLYFVSIIVGVTSMFSGEASQNTWMYLLPIYSSVNMLIQVLTFEIIPLHFAIMVISSVVYTAILIYVMNKLFESEKVMFTK